MPGLNSSEPTLSQSVAIGLLAVASFGNIFAAENHRLRVVGPMLAVSMVSAYRAGYIKPQGLLSLGLYSSLLVAFCKSENTLLKSTVFSLAFLMHVGFSLHKIPGFQNPVIIDQERLTSDATPLSLYVNFDKALAANLMMTAFPRVFGAPFTQRAFHRVGCIALATACLTLVAGVGFGVSNVAPAVRPHLWKWLCANALLVCPAEEVLFRGVMQNVLTEQMGPAQGLCLASALFGAAHFSGGKAFMALATVAGLGYGIAYQEAGVGASIAAHLFLNMAHFLGFTYPMLHQEAPRHTVSQLWQTVQSQLPSARELLAVYNQVRFTWLH